MSRRMNWDVPRMNFLPACNLLVVAEQLGLHMLV